MATRAINQARVGDQLVVAGHAVGQAQRVGEILEVLPDHERPHLRVRWQDGHESILSPSSDVTIRTPPRKAKAR